MVTLANAKPPGPLPGTPYARELTNTCKKRRAGTLRAHGLGAVPPKNKGFGIKSTALGGRQVGDTAADMGSPGNRFTVETPRNARTQAAFLPGPNMFNQEG